MINTTAEKLKTRNVSICRYYSVSEQLKSRAQLNEKLYDLGARLRGCAD